MKILHLRDAKFFAESFIYLIMNKFFMATTRTFYSPLEISNILYRQNVALQKAASEHKTASLIPSKQGVQSRMDLNFQIFEQLRLIRDVVIKGDSSLINQIESDFKRIADILVKQPHLIVTSGSRFLAEAEKAKRLLEEIGRSRDMGWFARYRRHNRHVHRDARLAVHALGREMHRVERLLSPQGEKAKPASHEKPMAGRPEQAEDARKRRAEAVRQKMLDQWKQRQAAIQAQRQAKQRKAP